MTIDRYLTQSMAAGNMAIDGHRSSQSNVMDNIYRYTLSGASLLRLTMDIGKHRSRADVAAIFYFLSIAKGVSTFRYNLFHDSICPFPRTAKCICCRQFTSGESFAGLLWPAMAVDEHCTASGPIWRQG